MSASGSGPTRRLRLVHGPTPVTRHARLCDRLGIDLWVKRDDMTGSADAGNKLRKLEWLLADARAKHAGTVITCGALQSNHARATAVACASLGLGCELLLWTDDAVAGSTGNLLIGRMTGARVHLISRHEYRDRRLRMQALAESVELGGGKAYVIPEGGSNGVGALGYVEAMRELREQMSLGLAGAGSFDLIAVACGSGGTAAGLALGAARYGVAREVRAFAVCNDASYFEREIATIIGEARRVDPSLPGPVTLTIDDTAKGPSYGVATPEQMRLVVEVARLTGMVLDPVYTGKAMAGLAQMVRSEPSWLGKRVLLVHTGSSVAALAHAEAFADFV